MALTLFFRHRDKFDQSHILRLVYGTTTPTKTDPKLFTILQVAKYLRLQVRRAQRLHDNFFREEANKRGYRAIPKDQIRYIVDNQTLIKMAELNL